MTRRAALLLALAAALYLPSIWTRDLWNPDEPRYAEATREMITRQDFILPHLNGDVYSEKPPLFFWLSAAAGAIPGIPAGSGGRLVSVLASAATLLLTWRIGALLLGEAAGWLAALILATSITFWHLAQSGVIDPLLAMLCTAAIFGFLRHREGRPGGMLLFYACCGLAVLAKGPVGLLVPGLSAAAFSLIVDGRRGLGGRHLLWGLPLVLLPVGLWMAAATVRGGAGYAYTMIVRQSVGRAVDAYIHKEPIWYFLPILPVAFLPWTIFLPEALVAAVRERAARIRPMLFPLVWAAATFVMFSVISGKKTRYLLPIFPAISLVVGGWIAGRVEDGSGRMVRGRWAAAAGALAGMILAGALATPALAGIENLPASFLDALREPGSEAALAAVRQALEWPWSLRIIGPCVILAGASLWGAWGAARGRREGLTALIGGWSLFLAAAGTLWMPVLNEVKSARHFADEIRGAGGEGPLYYIDNNYAGALNFYLRTERIPVLRRRDEIRAGRDRPGARFIGSRENLARAEEKAGVAFEPRICRRLGKEILCLAVLAPQRP